MPNQAYWKQLANDYVAAFKKIGLTPTRHAVLLAAAPAEFETNNSRAWPGTYNFGAVQGRGLTSDEQAKLASGELQAGARLPGNPGFVLHYDTNPDKGGAKYAVWFVAFPTQVDGIVYYLKVLTGKALSVLIDPSGTLRQLATAMYLGGYYQGRHAGARPYYKRSYPLLDAEKANINDYTSAIESTHRALEFNMGAYLPPEDKPMPEVTAFGKKLAELAVAHANCSAHVNQDVYIDVVVRPSDRGSERLDYYIGRQPPSTCGLFAVGLLRLLGLTDDELVKPYKSPPGAVTDLQKVAARHGVLEVGSPTQPFMQGDEIVIDEIIYDKNGKPIGDNAHVIVCVSDATVGADGKTWTVNTVQAGQPYPRDPTGGSSGIKPFVSTFNKRSDGKWYAGTGSRWVYCTARWSRANIEVEQPAEPPVVQVVQPHDQATPDVSGVVEGPVVLDPAQGSAPAKPVSAIKPYGYAVALFGIVGMVVMTIVSLIEKHC